MYVFMSVYMCMHVCHRYWRVPQWPTQLLSSVCRINWSFWLWLLQWISLASRQNSLLRLVVHMYSIHQCSLAVTDIDECLQGMAGCNHGCRNTAGSFICTCNDGYQLHHDDPTLCVGMLLHTVLQLQFHIKDINECVEYNGGCQHVCKNTIGSYSCNCHTGYELGWDDHHCEGTSTLLATCINPHGCVLWSCIHIAYFNRPYIRRYEIWGWKLHAKNFKILPDICMHSYVVTSQSFQALTVWLTTFSTKNAAKSSFNNYVHSSVNVGHDAKKLCM